MENGENNHKQEEYQSPNTGEQPLGKLAFLGVVTTALCGFPPFTLLAPVPLSLGFLLYGRGKGIILGVVVSLILFVMAHNFPQTFSLAGYASVFTLMYAVMVSETVFRKVSPVRGFLYSGAGMVAVLLFLWGLTAVFSDFSVEKMVEKNVLQMVEQIKTGKNAELLKQGQGEEIRALQDIVNNPKTLIKKILSWMPAGIFISIFLSLWASFFLVLRNWPLWKAKREYPFTIRDLISFKVPDYFVWPLIVGLVLMFGGEYVLGETGVIIGTNLLYCLGIFYFFHGFGVFLDFLNHINVFGFFRSFLVALTFLMAWRLLVFVGVFDMWVNFRRFFKKKDEKDEKDNE